MSVERTREVMMQYWYDDDFSKIDENAVYILIGTGQIARGREAIVQFLHDLYHVVFEAQAYAKNTVIEDGKACSDQDVPLGPEEVEHPAYRAAICPPRGPPGHLDRIFEIPGPQGTTLLERAED